MGHLDKMNECKTKYRSPLQYDLQVGKAKALTETYTLELLNEEGVKDGFCSPHHSSNMSIPLHGASERRVVLCDALRSKLFPFIRKIKD